MTASTTNPKPRLVAIGNFDGVHRGHQAILRHAVSVAHESGLVPTALTFFPHPAEVLGKTRQPVLTRLERKARLVREIDPRLDLVVKTFDARLAELGPREFVDEVLVRELGAARVLVGAGFRFGRGRAGDVELLRELGATSGFRAEALDLLEDDAEPISSTRVRTLLGAGDVEEACTLLGRPHRLLGTVEEGDRRGRTLGFPTANLGEILEELPLDGVYAVRVTEADAAGHPTGTSIDAPAVANLGPRPTVDRPHAVEVHLLDYEGDLYGRSLAVDFVSRIRGVQKFSSLDELRARIELDAREAARRLAAHP